MDMHIFIHEIYAGENLLIQGFIIVLELGNLMHKLKEIKNFGEVFYMIKYNFQQF